MRVRQALRKFWFTIFPFLIAVVLGGSFYGISQATDGDIKAILLSISASFFAIPILYYGYQVFAASAGNEMQRNVFEYFKAQIDTSTFSIMKHFVTLLDMNPRSSRRKPFDRLISLKPIEIRALFEKQTSILGFFLFRTFPEDEKFLDGLFRSYAMAHAFTSNQRTRLVELSQALVGYRVAVKSIEKFAAVLQKRKDLAVMAGSELNEDNTEFPYRHLLLRKLPKGEHQVLAFGDFPAYLKERLTTELKVDTSSLDVIAMATSGVLSSIAKWLKVTKNEIILRPDQFRLGTQSSEIVSPKEDPEA